MNLHLSLIICTYKRAESLAKLLKTLGDQTCYPNDIIFVDGSPDDFTKTLITQNSYPNLRYHKVEPHERGLTKQRNIGVGLCAKNTDIVAFLDDDIILYKSYFEQLIETYVHKPEAIAVGGYIINDSKWFKSSDVLKNKSNYFCFDGFCRPESLRFKLRTKFGLAPNRPPAHLPKFSHGRSVGFLPPSGSIYPVEQFMGGVSSYKMEVFDKIKFSSFFEGYGLYEDAEFCFKLRQHGQLYVNTAAQCEHHHHPSGRPNQFKYGQMVVRNGWYVWRTRWPNPGFKNILKWHANVLLLTTLRFLNVLTTKQKKQALTEAFGRLTAWSKLFFITPKFNN